MKKVFGFIAILLLVGCKTPKTVTETIIEHVHDTVEVVKSDTIKEVRTQTVRDTVRQIENHFITLNSTGDTIKEVHHLIEHEKVIVVDSTDRYKVKVDSLRQALYEEKNKDKTVVKTKYLVRWWEWAIFSLIVLMLVFAVFKNKVKMF